MKKNNLLIITTLTLVFAASTISLTGCGETKDLFAIDSKNLKQVYQQDESINLGIENKEEITIDSVVYFANDVKLGAAKNDKSVTFQLNKLKFGLQDIKAIVYYEGGNAECITSFELVSSISPKLYDTKNYTILNTYEHDSNAYTQGLEFHNGILLEGTGQNGESTLRKTDYKTGKVTKSVPLSQEYFGEGITVFNGKIYQLTWKNKVGFIYNAETLAQEKKFNYFAEIEGWGLTHNNEHLIMSDGSSTIYFLDPETQKMVRSINVSTDASKIAEINELEWIDGKIWANVYQKDAIIIINPENGAVESVINFSELKTKVKQHPELDVLNGIAYNSSTKTVFITGKNWDKMFEIKLNN